MVYSDDEKAIVWLCARSSLDERARARVLRAAGRPSALFSDSEKIRAAVIKEGGERVYINDCFTRKREAEDFLSALDRKGYFAVTPLSDDYPASLSAIYDPPLVLYGAGNRELLKKRKFCIVGSRVTPPWAEKQARLFAEEIARHFAVVTGLAEGGDAAALSGAIGSGNLICVLPNGLDECYPASHAALKERVKESGLLLSEYPPAEKARKYSFYARNRILAGLSEGVLVVAAGARSGTSITANYALENGRDVFAFPHNLGVKQGEGCNELLKKGAYVATEPCDVLSRYGIEEGETVRAELSEEEQKLLAVLKEAGEAHVSELAGRAGVPVYEVAATLSSLEMKNLAVKAGGNRYSAV